MVISAVYVTYNPDVDLLIKSLAIIEKIVDDVIIIDNSENPEWINKTTIKNDPNVKLLQLHENCGIAKALNIGYNQAIANKSDWALSMDQDSIVDFDIIDKFKAFIENNQNERIGALMPSFYLCPNATKLKGGKDMETFDYMTSGSLVCLKAFKETGGFTDELFIDLVDTDFGFKLIKKQYKIFRLGGIVMHHNIGNSKSISVAGRHLFYVTNHNYIRRYYITRNLLYIKRKYGSQFKEYANPKYRIFKSIIRIIVFEKDKLRKFRSIYYGIKDYCNNRYGKYSY